MSDAGNAREVFFQPQARPQLLLQLARQLLPILGGLPHDLATELRYGGGWIARGADESVTTALEELCSAAGVATASGPLTSDPLVHEIRQATLGDDGLEVHAPHWSRTLPLDAVALASLWIVGKVGPSPEHRAKQETKKRTPGSSFQLTVDAIPAAESDLREALSDAELDEPRLVVLVVQRDPIEVYQLDGEQTLFPDLGVLRFADALLQQLPEHKVLAETRNARATQDFRELLVHRAEELARRASWLGALINHGVIARD